jgi:hypothetical protein
MVKKILCGVTFLLKALYHLTATNDHDISDKYTHVGAKAVDPTILLQSWFETDCSTVGSAFENVFYSSSRTGPLSYSSMCLLSILCKNQK